MLTVMAQVGVNEFKATGKQIIDPAWRSSILCGIEQESDERVACVRSRGEGPHTPELQEKETQPPKYYTEADLLCVRWRLPGNRWKTRNFGI